MDMTDAEDRSLEESIGSFEAALGAVEPKLGEAQLERVLVVLDGSNQDDTVLALAAEIVRDAKAKAFIAACYEGPADTALDSGLRAAAESIVNAEAIARDDAAENMKSFEQILRHTKSRACELVVLCAPFREDFDSLGDASVGSNLDVLMARSDVPLLVVREPKSEPVRCLQQILLPITPYDPELVDAASWALRLGGVEASIRMLAVVDRDLLNAAGSVLKDQRDFDELDEKQLAGLNRPKAAGLIAAMQRHCAKSGQACRVSVRTGEFVPIISEFMGGEDALIIAQSPRNPGTTVFQRVQALTRASRNPVLIV